MQISVPISNPGIGMFFAADIARILQGIAQAQELPLQISGWSEVAVRVRAIQHETLAAVALACGLEVADV